MAFEISLVDAGSSELAAICPQLVFNFRRRQFGIEVAVLSACSTGLNRSRLGMQIKHFALIDPSALTRSPLYGDTLLMSCKS